MSWHKYAKPGDRIVCIDEDPHHWPMRSPLVKGRVYTVKDIVCERHLVAPGKRAVAVGVLIEEIDSAKWAFRPHRFRPVERSTAAGMSQLRTQLHKANESEPTQGELFHDQAKV